MAVAILIAAGSYLVSAIGRHPAPTVPAPVEIGLPADAPGAVDGPLSQIDAAITTWTGNLERNEADFIAAVNLAELYLARTRVTADPADIARALAAAESALAANPDLAVATLLRGQAHFASHDFAASAADAQTVLAAQPDSPHALAALGDARLELGDYAAARDAYDSLSTTVPDPAILARQARLAAVTGSLGEARELGADATVMAVADPASRPEIVAWYHTMTGALAFQAGDVDASAAAYGAALDAWSGSAAALAGLARSTAARGDLDAAIGLYEEAVAILPSPEALVALGDVQALAGQADAAAATHAKVRAVASLGPADRQLSTFEANHGEAQRAVELARADLRTRHDVYAHDTLAWALLAAGRAEEADAQMTLARAQRTEDALLDYHAGMIAAELGRSGEARELLGRALERNPGFDPLQAQRAVAKLAELEARP